MEEEKSHCRYSGSGTVSGIAHTTTNYDDRLLEDVAKDDERGGYLKEKRKGLWLEWLFNPGFRNLIE